MSLCINDYVLRFRDSEVERQLASDLRKEPEQERLRFIQELLASGYRHSFAVALWLAKTCLRERHSFETLLNQGLDRADASIIQYWLEAVIDGLGFRRVVAIITKKLDTDPESAIKARYWLPKWLPRDNKAAADALAVFDQAIEESVRINPSLERFAKPNRNVN